MTADDRVKAVAEFGFTERQARFVVLVMRHAGACIPRQYATFANIANGGEKCNVLFERLIDRGYAVACDCVHNRARLFHIHHRPLYRAIGEAESRYRRPVPAGRAVERLIMLDAVLATPGVDWMTTEAEKATYLTTLSAGDPHDNPSKAPIDVRSLRPTAPFGGSFPIGIDASGRAVLLYVATAPGTDEFRIFLQHYAALLRDVPAWTLRLVFARPLDRAYAAYQHVIREELESPLHRGTVTQLKARFDSRRAAGNPVQATALSLVDSVAEPFSTPRFTLLYRRWLKYGDTVFEAVSSPVLADALASGAGLVECAVLPHAYRHLSPLASFVRPTPRVVEKAPRRSEAPARAQPPPPESMSVSDELARDWYRLVRGS